MKQALYRKYRPADFSQVAGQQQVTATLKNEVAGGNISHAYLFTGVRGTGKTSCARILAKAVNCLSPRDGNPCNECDICKAVDSGTLTDVIEIDAASNTGVDNIRALREEISYLPQRAKYKIYIIDEVHMLSAGAFNALLKTLEEPPAHAIFILATTEVHKLPATILSRCQRFSFRRIDVETIAAYLAHIAEAEGFSVTDDALRMIASAADGGMRDAISLLDVCRAASENVDAAVVARSVGLSGSERVLELCGLVADGDISGCLSALAALYADSKEPERICEELLACLRNILVVKTAKNAASLINTDPAGLEAIRRAAERFTLGRVIGATAAVNDAISRMRLAYDKKTEAEMLLVSLCVSSGASLPETAPAPVPAPAKAEAKVAAVTSEAVEKEGDPSAPAAPRDDAAPEPAPKPMPEPMPEPVPEPVPEPAKPVSGADAMLAEALPDIKRAAPMVGALLRGTKCSVDGDVFTVHSTAECVSSNAALISDALYKAHGKRFKVVTDGAEPSFNKLDALDERLKKLFD